MEMEVEVRDRQRLIRIDRRWIESRIRKAARLLPRDASSRGSSASGRGDKKGPGGGTRQAPREVSVLLVNDERMRDLNLRYRGLDKTTDVLSFPQADFSSAGGRKGLPPACGPALLGDIVVNLHQARREAAARGITLKQEVSQLLVHGLLHLVGYDHEKGGPEERRMRRMERRLLEGPG